MSYVVYSARNPGSASPDWTVAGYSTTKGAADQVARALRPWGGQYKIVSANISASPTMNYELIPVYLVHGGRKYYYGIFTPSIALALRDALPDLVGGTIDSATMNQRLAMLR